VHVFSTKNGRRIWLGISITNTNKAILLRIKNKLGYGHLVSNKELKHKKCHKLRLTCKDAARFLKRVEPFLLIKKNQALAGIEFQQGISSRSRLLSDEEISRRLEIKQRISVMNHDYRTLQISKTSIMPLDYYAGFFDGEGCVAVRKNRLKSMKCCSYALIVGITNLVNVFEPLKEIYFGSISQKKSGIWNYYISSDKASQLLSDLLPFLRVKKREAVVGLQFYNEMKGVGRKFGVKGLPKEIVDRKEWFYQELQRLKCNQLVEFSEVPKDK
jgi:hypothetical protein